MADRPAAGAAAARALGARLAASHRLRNAGQWIIGTALALYFTLAVLAHCAAVLVLTGPLWRREKARLARCALP